MDKDISIGKAAGSDGVEVARHSAQWPTGDQVDDETEVAGQAFGVDNDIANEATEQAEVEGHFLNPTSAEMAAKATIQDFHTVADRERRAAQVEATKIRKGGGLLGRLRRRDG